VVKFFEEVLHDFGFNSLLSSSPTILVLALKNFFGLFLIFFITRPSVQTNITRLFRADLGLRTFVFFTYARIA
jgi:hypothetical protein